MLSQLALMGLAIFLVGLAQSASAMETEVILNQDKAISGNVTPGDAPGFPIAITRPGRYVLASNLYPMGKQGIEIQAYDVTIDFNGFILHGGFQQAHGIVGSGVNTVKIVNGVIAGFMHVAVYGRDSWVIENMRISANGAGIQLHHLARIQKNTLTINGSFGIQCMDGCHVEGNVISQNFVGVDINSGTVLGNTIYSNRSFGIKARHTVPAPIAFGNNMLWMNNGSTGAQVQGMNLLPLHPNACLPAC
jgi:hypothetical protein